MNRWWKEGLRHFQKENYFAARELWQRSMDEVGSEAELARVENSLGSVLSMLYGPTLALPHFERAVAVGDRTESDLLLRMRYRSNLSLTLGLLDDYEDALRHARVIHGQLSEIPPGEAAHLLAVYVYILLGSELYEELVGLDSEYRACFEALPDAQRASMSAKFYHNLGIAARSVGSLDGAMAYYMKALKWQERPETIQEMARCQLLLRHADEAVAWAGALQHSIWGFAFNTQKTDLADCLTLVATLAYHSGLETLFQRCVEKAELYYGQSSRWKDWLGMRTLENRLQEHAVTIPVHLGRWQEWDALLDVLNLLDGLETMFPKLFRLSQWSSRFAERLVARVVDVPSAEQHWLTLAGRMTYLGMTALAFDEEEARRLLADADQRQEVAVMGARLLEAYPHSDPYRKLVMACRTPVIHGPGQTGIVSQCLSIAIDYVEAVELFGECHRIAVERICEQRKDVSLAVLEAFADECTA